MPKQEISATKASKAGTRLRSARFIGITGCRN
jgi:hypothetical protein